MVRRIFTMLTVALIIAAIVLIITKVGQQVNTWSGFAKGLADLIFAILEIIGFVIFLYVLHLYIRYRRPYKVVFEGFSNAAKLVDADNEPIDINSLAQEELELQFQAICNHLKKAYHLGKKLGNSDRKQGKTNIPVFLTKDQHFEEDSRLDEIGWYLPSEGMLSVETIASLESALEKTIASFEDSGISNLLNSIEESAPKEIGPIIQFIDTLIPPPIIKVICHLQWKIDKVGITLEIIDLTKGRPHVLKNQTLWGTNPPSYDTQQSSRPDSSKDTNRTLARGYIELLAPAMRWLILLSWEYYYTREWYKKRQHISENRESDRSALLWLLGALYYASADHYPVCADFFRQSGMDRFSWVDKNSYPELCLPYLYWGERRFAKAKDTSNEIRRQHFLKDAQDWYEKALKDAIKGEASRIIQNYIRIRRAMTLLALENTKVAKQEIDQLINSYEIQKVAALDSLKDTSICSRYLISLGECIWHVRKNKKLARDYLIYSFVLASRAWDNKEVAQISEPFSTKFSEFFEDYKELFKFESDKKHQNNDATEEDGTGLTCLRNILELVLMDKEDRLPDPTDVLFEKKVRDRIINHWNQDYSKDAESVKSSKEWLKNQLRFLNV